MIIPTCWWQAGTRGGILLAWKSREVTITDPLFTTNAITAKVCTPTATATPWWLTVVYGSQEDADKIAFLREIRDIRADCDGPFQRVAIRLRTMARMLTSWSACTVSNVRHKMAISRDLILRYDKAQESRLLSPHEDWLRKEIKRAYIGLASLERTMARQRARLAFLPSTITNAPTGSRKTGSMASP
jgi:hypothetical protein